MSEHHEKPGSPGDILAHHGVKGMKWGVRNEDDTGGGGGGGSKPPTEKAQHNADTKMYMAAAAKIPKPTMPQARMIYEQNVQKSASKVAPSERPPTKGPGGTIKNAGFKAKDTWDNLSPQQKKALAWGAGTVAVYAGLYLAGNAANNKLQGMVLKEAGIKNISEIERLAGKPIDPKKFYGLVGFSQGKTWFGGQGYLTKEAFARPEFELPAGHTFYRLTTKAESSFGEATYATHSVDDFRRYVAGFRQEKGGSNFHLVTWTSKDPIKVPDVTTILGHLHGAMEADPLTTSFKTGKMTPERVAMEYQHLSGGGWNTPLAKSLIQRLKENGYGALVDEMDAGVIGETPLVFFGKESATPKISQPFGAKQIKAAEALLKEINNPPGRKY